MVDLLTSAQVWDWDRFKPNDFSGFAELPLGHLFREEKNEVHQLPCCCLPEVGPSCSPGVT